MIRYLYLLSFYFLGINTLLAQSLPLEINLSADGHRLKTGGTANQGLYDESMIRSIRLDFPQTNWWALLQQNYSTHTDIPAKMTVEGQVWDTVGVRFKGQTSYSQLGNSQKKSFNISLEYLPDAPKWMGYKTFNLNNCFLDASFLREFVFLHQIRNHIPAAKASFVNLNLNGQSWGIYPSVQQLNGDYLEEWFMSNNGTNWRADRPNGTGGGPGGGGGAGWGDGTAALNYLGTDSTEYKKYYTLKSTDSATPWEDLINTCDVLNTISIDQLPNELPAYLDIDRTLWFLASEIAFTDDDSYVYKGKMDYYLYFEPETGRITPLEYDGNSSFDAGLINSWTPFYHANNVNYPLLNRMLQVPAWRQRYLAHLRTINEELVNPTLLHPIIDHFAAQIDSLVQVDPKKIYSYSQFSTEVTEVKTFATTRYNNLRANTEMAQVAPSITAAAQWFGGVEWGQPTAGQEVPVQANITATSAGIDHIALWYATGIVGNFSSVPMFDDGAHNDASANDGIWGGVLPGQSNGTWVRWYIEAVANNASKSATYMPAGAEHDIFVYTVIPEAASGNTVVINEIMASNQTTATDESDQYDDWIELYNTTNQPVDLSGYVLTDNPSNIEKWKFPAGSTIGANQYLIVWADEDSSQGVFHCNFKLSASGERLLLIDPAGLVADDITFGPQTADLGYARSPNGFGDFVIKNATFKANNDAVGTEEVVKNNGKFILSPNPSSDWARLIFDGGSNGAIWQADIVDMMGRTVSVQTISDTAPVVQRNDLPAGLYTVVVRNDHSVLGRVKWSVVP